MLNVYMVTLTSYVRTHVRVNNNVQRKLQVVGTQSLYACTIDRLSFRLLDCQFTTVIATRRANGVVDVKCAAIRAWSQCRSLHYVMGTTFRLAGVRLSSFRMCHFALAILVHAIKRCFNDRYSDALAPTSANISLVFVRRLKGAS